jgi:excisionase family DNA binding protein
MVATQDNIVWLTPAELAVRFRISEDTARRIIHTEPGEVPRGKIPGIRLGRQFRVHIEDVERHEARINAAASKKLLKAMAGVGSLTGKDYFRD